MNYGKTALFPHLMRDLFVIKRKDGHSGIDARLPALDAGSIHKHYGKTVSGHRGIDAEIPYELRENGKWAPRHRRRDSV